MPIYILYKTSLAHHFFFSDTQGASDVGPEEGDREVEEGEVFSEDEGEAGEDEGDDGSEDEVFSEDEAEAVSEDEFEHMESPMSPDQ